MRRVLRTATALAVLLALAGCGKGTSGDQAAKPDDKKDAGPGITLSAEESAAMGLTTATLQPAQYRGQLGGFGVVVGLDTIAQADADTASAAAAAAQSRIAAARAKDLSSGDDAPVSRETYETAAAKAATDQAALALAQRKADAAFGLKAPWRGARRAAIMARLQAGKNVLVRVTFPIGSAIASNTPAQRLTITRMGTSGKSRVTSAVWDAPADPNIPGRSLFALVDGSNLAQGERVTATIAMGTAQAGVIVPAAALVVGESDTWAYLKTKDDTYLRTRIDTSRPQGDGYFVAQGLTPGQTMVTAGAGMLYAHEINPSTEPAD